MGNLHVFTFLAVITLALTCALGQSTSTDTIYFRHYNKNGSHKDINIQNITLLIPELDLSKWTMFYIHGYSETVDSTSVITITDAYSETDINVVAINYGQIAANSYFRLVGLTSPVAQAVAESLNKLQGNGLDQDKIHIVGHSFGGQISAQLNSYLNFTLPRITGLDPAGPLFYSGRFLKSGDAKFVDIIHTDKGFYGQLYNSGDINFLPNYGRRVQPGCPLIAVPLSNQDFCSHHRSWRFYAESVRNSSQFLGVQCVDDLAFQTHLCLYKDVVPMGFGTPSTARGVYYLRTNSESPFGEGLRGIK